MTGEETKRILREYQKTHPETAHYVVGPDMTRGLTKEKCDELLKIIKTRFPDSEQNLIAYVEKLNTEN